MRRWLFPSRWSLAVRLLLSFSLLLLLAWGAAAGLAWRESRDYIDKYFDTQQILFAKTLITADWESAAEHLPKTKPLLKGQVGQAGQGPGQTGMGPGQGSGKKPGKARRGREDKDALAFAVFTREGRLLLDDGEKGARFRFEAQQRGFVNTWLKDSDDEWRIFWVASPDGTRVAAVGQEREYREDMAWDMLAEQMLPWLLLFPLLLGGLGVMLHRELRPLRRVAAELRQRPPESADALATQNIPPEVRPLVTELNSLFARTAALLGRERAFVADAAHELRTPLAGLRVQAEVAALCDDDSQSRRHALNLLLQGIDRCSRLVEQLLTLSRLEGSEAGLSVAPLDWPALVQEAVAEIQTRLDARGLQWRCDMRGEPRLAQGYPSLMAVLLRNLLDNAVKYTPEQGQIVLTLDAASLCVINSGPGVDAAHVPRLGERFFRPPGQDAPGSGLGLSMVRHIAGLHGCTLRLENILPGTEALVGESGFSVRLIFG